MCGIIIESIECPYCGQHYDEFKGEWFLCHECDGMFRVRKVSGGYEISTVGDVPYAEVKAARPQSI